jgi:hypothetical protein
MSALAATTVASVAILIATAPTLDETGSTGYHQHLAWRLASSYYIGSP